AAGRRRRDICSSHATRHRRPRARGRALAVAGPPPGRGSGRVVSGGGRVSSALLDRPRQRPQIRRPHGNRWVDPRRVAPTLVAAAFAVAYVLVSPPSLDLAAHL